MRREESRTELRSERESARDRQPASRGLTPRTRASRRAVCALCTLALCRAPSSVYPGYSRVLFTLSTRVCPVTRHVSRRTTSRVGTSFPSAPAARAVTARLWRIPIYSFAELKLPQSSTITMNVASWEQSKWSVRRRAGKWTAWTDWFAQAVQGALMRQTGRHARLLSYADPTCARQLLVWPRLARQHHFQLCAPLESRRHRAHAMVR